MYNGFNPYGTMNYQFPNQNEGLVRVTGIEGAKAYQMRANSVAALFDANDDLFYIKTTDGAGFPSYRIFKFQEIHNYPQQNNGFTGQNSDFVTRQEFNAFKELITNGKQSVSTEPTANNNVPANE
jgi:hypothetical protein